MCVYKQTKPPIERIHTMRMFKVGVTYETTKAIGEHDVQYFTVVSRTSNTVTFRSDYFVEKHGVNERTYEVDESYSKHFSKEMMGIDGQVGDLEVYRRGIYLSARAVALKPERYAILEEIENVVDEFLSKKHTLKAVKNWLMKQQEKYILPVMYEADWQPEGEEDKFIELIKDRFYRVEHYYFKNFKYNSIYTLEV